jgi:hypothetical protein
VELVRLYSNLFGSEAQLHDVAVDAQSLRRAEHAHRPRQGQRRLNDGEVAELLVAHDQHQESIKHLAQRFKVHRTTIAALLRRHIGLSVDRQQRNGH